MTLVADPIEFQFEFSQLSRFHTFSTALNVTSELFTCDSYIFARTGRKQKTLGTVRYDVQKQL